MARACRASNIPITAHRSRATFVCSRFRNIDQTSGSATLVVGDTATYVRGSAAPAPPPPTAPPPPPAAGAAAYVASSLSITGASAPIFGTVQAAQAKTGIAMALNAVYAGFTSSSIALTSVPSTTNGRRLLQASYTIGARLTGFSFFLVFRIFFNFRQFRGFCALRSSR